MAGTIADAEVEQVWNEFWLPLVCGEDGTVDMEAVKRELFDYRVVMQEVRKVYMELTGGQFSKPNTRAQAVIDAANEEFERWAKLGD